MSTQENAGALDAFFHLREKGSTVRTEIIAGLTTFVALAYIIFVNPAILADAGIPKEAAIAATIWSTALTTMLMGAYANFPVALAPGMGLNAFFAYYVVGTLKLSWQTALGAVFVSGVVFFILTMTGLRQMLVGAVPLNIKQAIGVGIGLFIAFIGLKGAGIIVPDKATFLALGNLHNTTTLLSIAGLLLTAVLMSRGVAGSILIGIIATTVLGMVCGVTRAPQGMGDIMSFSVPSMSATFGQMDLVGAWEYGIVAIIFSFTIVDLFDTMGTLIGVAGKAGMVDKKGNIEGLDKAFTVDSVGTMIGACFGTPTVTSYIESAAGVSEGGRSGLTSVVVAICFVLSLFFAPFVGLVPGFATAPSLILVGALMMSGVTFINFKDFSEGLPAFLTIIMMPLTSSIAMGFAFGFISYVVIKCFTGKIREINFVMWVITAAFVVNLAMR